MKHKLPRGTLVEVSWMDAESDSAWHDDKDIDQAEPTVIKTVGYYHGCRKVGETVKWIILSHSVARDGQADYTLIPWGAVLSMEKII